MDIKNIKKEWNAAILDILKTFISICHTHNLRYYCCAGTAIGAVRHHGMIPWDMTSTSSCHAPTTTAFLR